MNWKMHLDATTTRAEPWLCEPQHWERAHAHRVERNVETYHGCCGSQSRAPLLISSCALRTKCAMLVAALLGAVTFAPLADQLIPADGTIDYCKH